MIFLASWRNLVFLAFIAAIVAFLVAGRDIPPPDTADLVAERPPVPDDANAYGFFIAATNFLQWPTNSTFVCDFLDGKPVDPAPIEDVIELNSEAVNIVRDGLVCGICLFPEVNDIEDDIYGLGDWRNIARVMTAKARRDRLAGRYDAAVDECAALLRFGALIQKDAETIVHYFVGLSILDLGFEQARDIAGDAAIPGERLSALSEALAGLGPFDKGFIRGMKGEYKVVANAVDRFKAGKFDEESGMHFSWPKKLLIFGYLFQANRTKLYLAGFYRNMIGNATVCYADITPYVGEDMPDSFFGKFAFMVRPNAIGKILSGLWLSSPEKFNEKRCRSESHLAAARLVVALNAYEKTEGALPGDLAALVPAYIESVPRDPYDGEPFRYSPARGIIYSVGKDIVDSGGSTNIPCGEPDGNRWRMLWEAEDIVFEIKTRGGLPEDGDSIAAPESPGEL